MLQYRNIIQIKGVVTHLDTLKHYCIRHNYCSGCTHSYTSLIMKEGHLLLFFFGETILELFQQKRYVDVTIKCTLVDLFNVLLMPTPQQTSELWNVARLPFSGDVFIPPVPTYVILFNGP